MPEQITLDQLRALDRFTDTIIDPTNKSLGLPGIMVRDYRQSDIKAKLAAAINKHPENKAYVLLKNFYATHMGPMQNAMYAVTGLDPYGAGYARSNAAISDFRKFIEAVEALDPHFAYGMNPANYAPDLTQVMQAMDKPDSTLRNPGFAEAKTLYKNLDITLGAPVASLPGSAPTPFADHMLALGRAEAQWGTVIQEMYNLKATRARNP